MIAHFPMKDLKLTTGFIIDLLNEEVLIYRLGRQRHSLDFTTEVKPESGPEPVCPELLSFYISKAYSTHLGLNVPDKGISRE